MKNNKWIFLVALACLSAIPAAAQDHVPVAEVSVGYSYFRFNPTIPQLHSRSFNGGGGSAIYNVNSYLGIKAEFMGFGSTSWTTTFAAPVVTPHGTIPAGTFQSQGNMFTYLFGPQATYRTSRVNYFAEFLFGGSNSNGYANLIKSIDASGGTVNVSGTQHPFTMAIGGGAADAHGLVSSTGAAAHDHDDDDAPLPEQNVSSPARLAQGAAPAYPPDAREDGVEADVPMEIVVSGAGAVESARVVQRAGHGLDEAALAAVRRFRFTPASKDGRPVRVRMRWTMQFRLRQFSAR